MVIIRRKERGFPVVGVADSWEAFRAAKIEELKEKHAKWHPDSPWESSWEKHYEEVYITNVYHAEEVKNYWKG